VVALAGEMIYLGEKAADPGEGKKRAAEILRSGAALAKFRELAAAQGGDAGVVDDPESLLVAPVKADVAAPSGGWVAAVDSCAVGLATMALGAGRVRKEDAIDPSVGIVLRKKVGDAVRPGESLATVHARSDEEADTAATAVLGAYSIESQPAKPAALLIQRLEGGAGSLSRSSLGYPGAGRNRRDETGKDGTPGAPREGRSGGPRSAPATRP